MNFETFDVIAQLRDLVFELAARLNEEGPLVGDDADLFSRARDAYIAAGGTETL